MKQFTETLTTLLSQIDAIVWGPVTLILLVGTGIFLTIRTKAACWRNLPYALKSLLSRESRQTKENGDVSPFSALMTALAATIGTGNIVGVATAMVSGGPGALIWMWISAAFGLTSKFSECMLAVKYREINEKGEMSGGPMYTMKKAFSHKKTGAALGWLFALFAVLASFGIGNLTQANSISTAIHTSFHIPSCVIGAVITVPALIIIIGGIQSISKVSQIVVPVMAIFYIISALLVIIGNVKNLPSGMAMIFKMAFSQEAVGGGLCGSIAASMSQALRFGVARGVFSNEAGMGSAAITAAAASTNDPVRQGYINMTGTFWDTIIICSITGLCIASSGVLGSTELIAEGNYSWQAEKLIVSSANTGQDTSVVTSYTITKNSSGNIRLIPAGNESEALALTKDGDTAEQNADNLQAYLTGTWHDASGNQYLFEKNGNYEYRSLIKGASLTIAAFQTVLGNTGGWLISISIALFAFSTILGWEYHGEKAYEYILGTRRYNMLYRIFFSLLIYIGATTTMEIAWTFSDIANALMAIPNLICLLALSSVVAKETKRFEHVIKEEKLQKTLAKKQIKNGDYYG